MFPGDVLHVGPLPLFHGFMEVELVHFDHTLFCKQEEVILVIACCDRLLRLIFLYLLFFDDFLDLLFFYGLFLIKILVVCCNCLIVFLFWFIF